MAFRTDLFLFGVSDNLYLYKWCFRPCLRNVIPLGCEVAQWFISFLKCLRPMSPSLMKRINVVHIFIKLTFNPSYMGTIKIWISHTSIWNCSYLPSNPKDRKGADHLSKERSTYISIRGSEQMRTPIAMETYRSYTARVPSAQESLLNNEIIYG